MENTFLTGEQIPATGVYRVMHAAHRLPAECTLIAGQQFPRCGRCDTAVYFQCVTASPASAPGPPPMIVLYQLPELPPDDPQRDKLRETCPAPRAARQKT